MITEYDLFQGNSYADDPGQLMVTCSGLRGCGSLVANQSEPRRLHVDFHNDHAKALEMGRTASSMLGPIA